MISPVKFINGNKAPTNPIEKTTAISRGENAAFGQNFRNDTFSPSDSNTNGIINAIAM